MRAAENVCTCVHERRLVAAAAAAAAASTWHYLYANQIERKPQHTAALKPTHPPDKNRKAKWVYALQLPAFFIIIFFLPSFSRRFASRH
jgi:hypothetical protein